ncbi:2-hydroxychromene-2-carboxylate isomerase [Ideonella sp. BN130291]|uniref:2-hydroxychromene-2-carboxylate isomerase n=1 Tax=Ideonella sp. BN130291 TaxID=3112940 RepID=UPI002E26A175|nr:2-hydroxychromene-2-carboxylate isomerase [Ideonella sp. BN130291]
MTPIDFYFDPISPYAYLAFERLPQALEGCSYVVNYKPVLFAGMLKHWGQKGPAEIAPKRDWTMRQVTWLAHRQGTPLQLPAQHPFNPLALLRLVIASAPAGAWPNRRAVELVFRHVWIGGADANEPARLQALQAALQLQQDPAADAVKQALRSTTDEAIARGVFGVPTIAVDQRLFWGVDALEMVAACLKGDPWFEPAHWAEVATPTPGVVRG